jgi:hypothetical protein
LNFFYSFSACFCLITTEQHACLHAVPCAGPPLLANRRLSIRASGKVAGYVQVNSASAPATISSGDGSTLPEQFIVVNPSSPDSVLPIMPGQTAVLWSVASGQYCRLAQLPPSQSLTGLRCDLPTMAKASQLTYTGSGLSSGGVPLVATTAGGPLVLANTTTSASGPDSKDLSFPVSGPPLVANSAINILTSSGSYARVDNLTSPAVTSTGYGTTSPQQFIATHPASPNSTTPIQPGETAILRSVATGAYCRLTAVPSNSLQLGMVCDQPTAATATVLTYTGSGLSYNGVPLVATALGGPLLLANTTTSPATPASANLSFPVAITGGRPGACTLWFPPSLAPGTSPNLWN